MVVIAEIGNPPIVWELHYKSLEYPEEMERDSDMSNKAINTTSVLKSIAYRAVLFHSL